MSDIKDFATFYDKHLLPVLPELRSQSQASKRWLFLAAGLGVFTIVYFLISLYTSVSVESNTLPILIFGVATIACLGMYVYTKDDFTLAFKEKIIGRILTFIAPNIIYRPDTYINSRHYIHSSLVRTRYTGINGDDMFKGSYKNVAFKCSELTVVNDGTTLFNGLFFYAKINKYFNGGTYVWSKGSEHVSTNENGDSRFFPMPNSFDITMDDFSFDSCFTVKSTYPAQTKKLLTSYRRQQMLNYIHKINKNISFSFVGGYCYVAVPQKGNLFASGKDPGDKEKIKEYFMTILLFLSFIDKLMLDEIQ